MRPRSISKDSTMWKFIKRILAAANSTSFRSTVAGVGGMVGGVIMIAGGDLAAGGSMLALGSGLVASADSKAINGMIEKAQQLRSMENDTAQ